VTALDGRTARRDRNRVAVLDAVIELFSEGDLDPSPEAVAARSGVSLRSVYRYVADKEDLARAAIDRHVERVGHLFLISDIGNGSLAARIDRFVDARLALYAAIAPTNRAARLRAPTAPVIERQLERARRQMREQLERHFAPELGRMPPRERRNVAAAADAVTQIESLDLYHLSYGFSARVTRDVLVAALARLLG
jgi:AcrR family transcriptional regulator